MDAVGRRFRPQRVVRGSDVMLHDLSPEHRNLVGRVSELSAVGSPAGPTATTGPPPSPPRTSRTWSAPGFMPPAVPRSHGGCGLGPDNGLLTLWWMTSGTGQGQHGPGSVLGGTRQFPGPAGGDGRRSSAGPLVRGDRRAGRDLGGVERRAAVARARPGRQVRHDLRKVEGARDRGDQGVRHQRPAHAGRSCWSTCTDPAGPPRRRAAGRRAIPDGLRPLRPERELRRDVVGPDRYARRSATSRASIARSSPPKT